MSILDLVNHYNKIDNQIECPICFDNIGLAFECKQCKQCICSDCFEKILENSCITYEEFEKLDFKIKDIYELIWTDGYCIIKKKKDIYNCPYCNFPINMNDEARLKIINFKNVKNTRYNKKLKFVLIQNHLLRKGVSI